MGFLALILLVSFTNAAIEQSHGLVTRQETTISDNTIALFAESDHDLQPNDVRFLSTYGSVTTIAGPVAVFHVSSQSFSDLEQAPTSLHFQHPQHLTVYLDDSVPDIGANTVWDEVRDPLGRNVTGAGVIIGIVDTGIDTTHPDFYFPNGTTKILYVWDQTTQGKPPAGFDYGYECTSGDIQSKTCPEIDTFGHGTHVAGIAASSGQATGKYFGVAPGASIIFVKSGNPVCDGASWNFYDSQILEGVNYIVKKAAQLKMRAVISLSLGGNIGAHDGTSPLELGLEAFVQAGTPIVVAAGNSARDAAHIRGILSQGNNVTVNVQVRAGTTDLQLDVWYSNRDQFDATLIAPDGDEYSIPTPPAGETGSYGNITTFASHSASSGELYMEVNSSRQLSTQVWKVALSATRIGSSNGTWDGWVDTETCDYPGAFFLSGKGYEIDSHDTIGIPGTARDVVTVGAYITKTAWTGIHGDNYTQKDLTVGMIASFSSMGPTRDGRVKPDVVAPGMFIASARASTIPQSSSDPDAFHRVLAGTSMATPHVAGVVALMLQYDPSLPATIIPGILRTTARLDEFTGLISAGSPAWGFGKVDSRTATGFFRLTFATSDIPVYDEIPIRIDSTVSLTVPGETWSHIYFLKGTRHSISFATEVAGSNGARYELQSVDQVNLNASALMVIHYNTQYALTVHSQFGVTAGPGWYNANSSVTINVPKHANAEGWVGMIGGEYVLARLVTEDGETVSNPLVIDRPTTVTAVYALSFPIQTYVGLVVITMTVVLYAVWRIRRGKNFGATVTSF